MRFEVFPEPTGYTQKELMALRDQFAMAALQTTSVNHYGDSDYDKLAKEAYKVADAMMGARKR